MQQNIAQISPPETKRNGLILTLSHLRLRIIDKLVFGKRLLPHFTKFSQGNY